MYRPDTLTRRLWAGGLACLCGILAATWVGQTGTPRVGGAGFDRAIPLQAGPEISRVIGRDIPGFAVGPAPGGFRMRNAGITAGFDRRGVVVRSARADWLALSLHGVGYAGALEGLRATAPRAAGNVVTYRRGAVTEWYANGPLGLEQGFTLTRRPAVAARGPLTLELGLSGSLRGSLSRGGVSFGSGRRALSYTMPVASDAGGRTLRAWLELRGNRLLLQADDRGARYPVRIDPFIRAATLHASDAVHGSFGYHFGSAVAATADTIAIGAPDAGIGTGRPEGAVYVFTKPASGWADATQTAKLTASDGGSNDQLGASVAISGDTIVAGAPNALIADHNSVGALYVFTRPAPRWANGTETAKLTASDGAGDDLLGRSVAIDGDTIAGGAPGAHIGANANQGAVYVFTRPAAGWQSGTEAAKLTASDGAAQDGLGNAVGLSGDTLAAGGGDAVYVFTRPSNGWPAATHEQAKLTAPGQSLEPVAIDGNTIAAGAPGQNSAPGAAEVFVEPASGWSTTSVPTAQLTSSIGSGGGEFGFSIAIHDGRIVVGAPFEPAANTFEAGAAYVYDRPSAGWASETESARLIEPNPALGDQFGSAVAIVDDTTLLAGAPLSTLGGVQQGLAYVLTGPPPSGGGGTTTTTVGAPPHVTSTTTSPPAPTPAPVPPPPSTGCLTGDAKYPDVKPGQGEVADYDLSDPTRQADGTVEQTLDFGLSMFNRAMWVTTGGCWSLQTQVSGQALNGFDAHEEFGTYGEVNLDGVILAPVNAHGGPLGPAELHVGTNGRIYATGDDTRYSVEIVNADGVRVTVGQVDLQADSWRWDGGPTSVIGQFGPAPGGPCPFGRPLAGGTVTAAGFGRASLTVFVQLPPRFSSTPDGGPAPTANLDYGQFTNPNVPSQPTGGGGGGSGGTLRGGQCDPQTNPHCGHNLAVGDRAVAGCGSGTAPAGPGGGSSGSGGQPGSSGVPLHLTAPELYLGALRLTDVFLNYDPATDVWNGGGDAQLGGVELRAAPPPPDNGLGLHSDGSFDHGGASLAVQGGVPVFPGVDLTELGVTFAVDPTRFSGDATLSVAGGLVTVHGGVFAVFATPSHPYTYQPFALPGVQELQTRTPITSTAFGVAGTVGLQVPVLGEADLANGYVFYINIDQGYFEFAGHVQVGVLGVSLKGDVAGALDVGMRRFDLEGMLQGCASFPDPIGDACAGVDGVVSSAGIGACGEVKPPLLPGPTIAVGFTYRWGDSLPIILPGCDLGPVKVDVRASRDEAAQAAGVPGFALPPGLPRASVVVSGAGGPPRVTIAGPHGERASSDPSGRLVDTGRFVILPMRDQNETLIGIDRPAGGRWTITPEPGSPAITMVSHANGLPPAQVIATVRGGGRRRQLVYRVRARAGQTVTFAERAGHVFHVLGDARAARGTLGFTPALAPIRHRQIVALISLSGVPSQTLVAGSYTAPVPPRLGAVRRLHVVRRGDMVIATWSPAARASSYAITITLSDGQRLALSAAGSQHRIAIGVPVGGLGASVTVQGIATDGSTGPARGTVMEPSAGPARVRGISEIRTRAGVLVRWRPVRGAVAYLVSIIVRGAGGPAYSEITALPRLRPSVDLARLRPGRAAEISVRAVNADAKLGPPGAAVYRADNHKPH